jgi:hypothetical protein
MLHCMAWQATLDTGSVASFAVPMEDGWIRRRRQQDAAGAVPRLQPTPNPTSNPTFGAGSGSDQDGEIRSVPRSGSVVISNRGMTFAVPMDDEPPQPSTGAAIAIYSEPVQRNPGYSYDECDPNVCYVNGSTSPIVYAIPLDANTGAHPRLATDADGYVDGGEWRPNSGGGGAAAVYATPSDAVSQGVHTYRRTTARGYVGGGIHNPTYAAPTDGSIA